VIFEQFHHRTRNARGEMYRIGWSEGGVRLDTLVILGVYPPPLFLKNVVISGRVKDLKPKKEIFLEKSF
jgi:hypothetical protein